METFYDVTFLVAILMFVTSWLIMRTINWYKQGKDRDEYLDRRRKDRINRNRK